MGSRLLWRFCSCLFPSPFLFLVLRHKTSSWCLNTSPFSGIVLQVSAHPVACLLFSKQCSREQCFFSEIPFIVFPFVVVLFGVLPLLVEGSSHGPVHVLGVSA